MNCDTAFDLMTDPETAGSSALARHLESCPRCRQMQETLAPALDLLSCDGQNDLPRELPGMTCGSREGGRRPVVTIEALQIAEQAASRLAAQCETRRVRMQRMAARGLRYAAVFAAGCFLAAVFFTNREHSVPSAIEARCTRGEADRNDIERSAAEIRRLALSCALCHDRESQPASDSRTTMRPSQRPGGREWLRSILAEETLLALRERPVSVRGA